MNNTIMCNGKPVYYRKTGEGKPVVLLHGFAEEGVLWRLQLAYLEKNYQLIIPDLPGSGLSAQAHSVSMESMAEVVKCILAEEAITGAVMIGHSMGGYVTLAFAEKYPHLLKGFGLFHSTAFADGEEKKESRNKNIHFIHANGTYAFLKQAIPGLFSDAFKKENRQVVAGFIERHKDFQPASLVAYLQAMMERPDRSHVLESFPHPVLFIIGRHDNAVPLQDSLQQSHLPVKSYIHILDTGHMGMLEEPDNCNRILEEFLRDAL